MDELRAVVAEVLGVDPKELADDAGVDTFAEWTSLQHLDVIASVENHYGFQMSMDEMSSAQSLPKLYALVLAYRDMAG